MSVPDDSSYDPAVHLDRQDIHLDNTSNQNMVKIRIKQSEMDPLRKEIDLCLGKMSSDLCPVTALLNSNRDKVEGPLFVFKYGKLFMLNRVL